MSWDQIGTIVGLVVMTIGAIGLLWDRLLTRKSSSLDSD
jgi:hypothetical protein